MWWPRKPQPPITSTLPKGSFWVVIGAIVLCWRFVVRLGLVDVSCREISRDAR